MGQCWYKGMVLMRIQNIGRDVDSIMFKDVHLWATRNLTRCFIDKSWSRLKGKYSVSGNREADPAGSRRNSKRGTITKQLDTTVTILNDYFR